MTAPVYFHILLASVGCWLAIRARRGILAAYLAPVAFIGSGGLAVLAYGSDEAYRLFFLLSQITHNVLLIVLALETISTLAPRRAVVLWSLFWLSLFASGAVLQTADLMTLSLLNLTASADFCACGLLLLPVLRSDTCWTRGTVLTAAGVGLVALLPVLLDIPLLQEQETLRALVPWAGLPGLVLLVAASTRSQESSQYFFA